jgi:multidrug efflux pump subunit AcrA (membrane-fusion protein)
MTQLSKTFERPSSPVPAAVAGLLVVGAIAIAAFAAGFGLGTRESAPQAAAAPAAVARVVSASGTTVRDQLQSEYLREISAGW